MRSEDFVGMVAEIFPRLIPFSTEVADVRGGGLPLLGVHFDDARRRFPARRPFRRCRAHRAGADDGERFDGHGDSPDSLKANAFGHALLVGKHGMT